VVIPASTIQEDDTVQVFPFPGGKLDTGTFGSVRSLIVLGTLINDADVRVGFSSESSGLQSSTNSLILIRVPFHLPARLEVAMGELNGTLLNQGARFITGSYTESIGVLPTIPVGTTFASPSFRGGGFAVNGVVENLTFTTGSSWTTTGTWTNHGDLSVLGRIPNTGLFESLNAPFLAANPPGALPYSQTITLGEATQPRSARFDNEPLGVVELRNGTTFVNAAEFTNRAGAAVTVRQDAVLETTGTYSTATSILAGRFQQMAGASTIVDGVFRTRERGAILNDGLILVSGGGALENGNYVLNQSGGTIKVLEGASLTQGPQGYLRGRLENEGRLEVEGTMTGGDLVTTGRLIVASGGVLGTDNLSIRGGGTPPSREASPHRCSCRAACSMALASSTVTCSSPAAAPCSTAPAPRHRLARRASRPATVLAR
jgi:hypothetical protein